MRVLVTGAAGYLGSVLCEHLLAVGHEVMALDNLMHGQRAPLAHLCYRSEFNFVLGDARDVQLMHRLLAVADAVIPLAALVGAPACDRDPWLSHSVNYEAIRILNLLRNPGCPDQLVIFPNTNSGYGAAGSKTCDEDSPLRPISQYGRDKVEAETLLLRRPNVIVLRLATVFGMSPRMRLDLLVNDFVHRAVTDRRIVVFEKDFRRNFVHVRDVADCFLFCLEHPEMAGRPYNLGLDSANLTKGELALAISRKVPGCEVSFSSTTGHDPDRRDCFVSTARLRAAGFEARRTLEDGIDELKKGCRMLGRDPCRNA